MDFICPPREHGIKEWKALEEGENSFNLLCIPSTPPPLTPYPSPTADVTLIFMSGLWFLILLLVLVQHGQPVGDYIDSYLD